MNKYTIDEITFDHKIPEAKIGDKVVRQEHNSKQTAEIITIMQPFGYLVVVRAFSGESIYTVHLTGGHAYNAVIVKQPVDSPITTQDLTEAVKENGTNVVFTALIQEMSPGLGEAVRQWALRHKFLRPEESECSST